MKKGIFFIFFCFAFHYTNTYCQSTEYRFTAGTGLFHYNYSPYGYGQADPYYYSVLIYNPNWPFTTPVLYANYPLGNQPGFSWHLSLDRKKISQKNIIVNWALYFESRQCKKQLNHVLFYLPLPDDGATGEVSVRNNMAAISGNIGKRFSYNNSPFYIDLLLGFDFLWHVTRAHQVIDAVVTANGFVLHKDLESTDSGKELNDIRLNGKIELGYQRWGISSGYAIGFHNPDGFANTMNYDIKNGNTSRYLYTGLYYLISKKKDKTKVKKD